MNSVQIAFHKTLCLFDPIGGHARDGIKREHATFHVLQDSAMLSRSVTIWAHEAMTLLIKFSEQTLHSLYGPTVGALNAESPKIIVAKQNKQINLVAKQASGAQIYTTFCMRETTHISDGFRMRDGPLGP